MSIGVKKLVEQIGFVELLFKKVSGGFSIFSGIVLFVTGLAKIVSAFFGKAHILEQYDPIFEISFKHLMLVVGIVELTISGICFFNRATLLRLSLIAWISTGFAFYRAGLVLLHWHRPCACMGNLTDALHISPNLVDFTMKYILALLIGGSYLLLFLRLQTRKASIVQ